MNPSGSRFCHLCGEKLTVAIRGIHQGLILGDRYQIIRELGQGGFGRTYLAEDINRFNEACVLKEFAPQVHGSYALQKSEELFEREAGVLYKLKHPQIPRFRELFRADLDNQGILFLVQDYVEGRTYQQLLEARRKQGLYFSELEVRQLLEQVLPVLQYLHISGVIHRDISPDNLMLRSSDQLPVLIDFGGVKQIAAEAASRFVAPGQAVSVTRLGKVGFAPEEQMLQGIVSPQSDLYALAVTALVLLTGKDAQNLLSSNGTADDWLQQLNLNPTLAAVLSQMLAPTIEARFQSAQDAWQSLRNQSHPLAVSQVPMSSPAPDPTELSSQPMIAPTSSTATYAPLPSAHGANRQRRGIGVGLVMAILVTGIGGTGWWLRDRWLPQLQVLLRHESPISRSEVTRQEALQTRRQALEVDNQFLVSLTNATFYQRYPKLKGQTLSDSPEDEQWRIRWDGIANDWLTTLEQHLSTSARRKLGHYTSADREQWKQQVNQLYVSSRSLFDLTDARFFNLFPDEQGKDFIDQPIGQVWQAIAGDQVSALQSGKTLEQIQFDSGTYSKQVSRDLASGAGRVYLANLTEGQILRLNLQAPHQTTLLSIYLPRPTQETPFLLSDSPETTWTGRLPQSGYYEIVIVTKAAEPISYQLNLAVDNVTSAPAEPDQAEAQKAKDAKD
jgi:serine/threonine-protein kinase